MDIEDKRGINRKEIIAEYAEHVSSGKVAFYKKFGINFVMGERSGPYIKDVDGKKELINLHCNGGVFNLGHRNEEIIAILSDSLKELDIGNHHLLSPERAETALLLAKLMPGELSYAIFGAGGGEAVDLAVKTARAYTGKTKIISCFGGFHGHTGYALSAGDEKYRAPFGPRLPGFMQVPFNDLRAMDFAIDDDTAAVILETIPATLGIVIPPSEYLKGVERLCRTHEVLLIMDEIQTGLGRTGKLWAFEHFGIQPDIVVIGKGLSGGVYPVSATVITKKLEAVFRKDPFIHISTFGGSELGCRVARRVLEISSERAFLDHVNSLAGIFKERTEELIRKHKKFLTGFRQLGLMMGLEFKEDIDGLLMSKASFDNGLLMIYANNDKKILQFLPPLNLKEDTVDEIILRLDRALTQAKRLRPAFKLLYKTKALFERKRES